MKKTPQDFSAQDEAEENTQNTSLSRRSFLNTAGAATVGGLIAVAGGSLLLKREARAEAVAQAAAPPLPWKYSKLDPMEAGKRGYKYYLANGG